MTDLRLMIVINGLGTGGAERSLAELIPHLHADGIRPQIVVIKRRREGVESQILQQCDAHFLKSRHALTRAVELRKLIKRLRPHLVHTTLFESNVIGRLATVGTSVPLLTSLVNTPYDRARRVDPNVHPIHMKGVRVIDRVTAPLTTHFQAITEAVKAAAIKDLHIPPHRITVIPRGRNRARLGEPGAERRRTVRAKLGIDHDKPLLITVGRQEYQKGQRYLIEAMRLVSLAEPNALVLIVGRDGNASDDLASAMKAEAGLADKVRFLGHRNDVPDLLAAADVFVFPSLWEGLGGALIEAMALGLPIVVSDIPAVHEVVEVNRNALLVKPGAPEPLANAILRLIREPQTRADFADRSRKIFADRFELEQSTSLLIDLYRRMADGGRRKDQVWGDRIEDQSDQSRATLPA